jgi:hypothetical protein
MSKSTPLGIVKGSGNDGRGHQAGSHLPCPSRTARPEPLLDMVTPRCGSSQALKPVRRASPVAEQLTPWTHVTVVRGCLRVWRAERGGGGRAGCSGPEAPWWCRSGVVRGCLRVWRAERGGGGRAGCSGREAPWWCRSGVVRGCLRVWRAERGGGGRGGCLWLAGGRLGAAVDRNDIVAGVGNGGRGDGGRGAAGSVDVADRLHGARKPDASRSRCSVPSFWCAWSLRGARTAKGWLAPLPR